MRRWLRIGITTVAVAAGHLVAYADSAARGVLVVEAQIHIAAEVQRIGHAADVRQISPEATLDACLPVRIVVFDDRTGSAPAHRVAPVREDQVLEMVGLLRACGGELAIGWIRDRSDRPLVRLRVETPPPPPVLRRFSNPYEQGEERARYAQARRVHAAAVQRWESRTRLEVARFLATVRPMLGQAPDAPRSAICQAMARADLFLSEPQPRRQTRIAQFAVFVSDGEDSEIRGPCRPLRAQAELVVVNGVGELGAFAGSTARQFESLDAAITWIRNTRGRN